jgi:hypothetical protein
MQQDATPKGKKDYTSVTDIHNISLEGKFKASEHESKEK